VLRPSVARGFATLSGVFFIFCGGDPRDWVHMVDDGVYDGKRHLFGPGSLPLSKNSFFFDIGYHLCIVPGIRLLARIARPAPCSINLT